MITFLIICAVFAYAYFLAYQNASLQVWTISIFIGLLLLSNLSQLSVLSLIFIWVIIFAPLIILNIYPLRRFLISKQLFSMLQKAMPSISRTEKEAIEAGNVGWEAELLSGAPNWKQLIQMPSDHLSEEEQAFVDGPVQQLCSMLDDWDITHRRADLPPEVWEFIKKHKFWGMVIPKQYGGLAFSTRLQINVLTILSTRSVTASITVGVPNSLGPAELLLKYGSEQQKQHYLPRLVSGDEIPCFALTGPHAGSDAASIPDKGIICHGNFEGKKILGIRLNWDKRYITLAPVATLLGLAFHLYDPDKLIGSEEDIGISIALIPMNTAGIIRGRRHFPLNTAFLNGPTQGTDVFIPIEWVIGGKDMLGRGWQMLMACLSAGRAISLPSGAHGGAQLALLTSSAYARIRKQFNRPIGYFEGIEEPLTRITIHTYIIDAVIDMVVSNLGPGVKSAISSAIVKYHTTELSRKIINDAMDIHGGKGICLGPRDYLARAYQVIPIGITVEGANILTRSLIIFGQGLIRCHQYIYDEMNSFANNDLKTFDRLIYKHVGFTITVTLRTFLLALTQGSFVKVPTGSLRRYFKRLTRYSAALAFITELSLITFKGNLKIQEKLTGRLGDILSDLFLASAVLKKFETRGRSESDQILAEYACQQLIYNIEQKISQIIQNFPNRSFAMMMRIIILPFGKRAKKPSDKLSKKVVKLILAPSKVREALTQHVYLGETHNNPVSFMEQALRKVIAVEALEKKVHLAVKSGQIKGLLLSEQIEAALQAGVINDVQAKQMRDADAMRTGVISVDDFAADELAVTKE